MQASVQHYFLLLLLLVSHFARFTIHCFSLKRLYVVELRWVENVRCKECLLREMFAENACRENVRSPLFVPADDRLIESSTSWLGRACAVFALANCESTPLICSVALKEQAEINQWVQELRQLRVRTNQACS